MALEKFRDHRFGDDIQILVDECNGIIADYLGQGLRLTLRQLYYQLVTRNIIPNEERSYKRLSALLSDARLAGLVDWDAIEDRVRVPRRPPEWDGLEQLVEAALHGYRLPRWEGQPKYVELWVEKDALAGVLAPLASEFHVVMMVNRGYSSQSAMYEAAARFKVAAAEDKDLVLFYLGDHDPSGEDMVRDVRDRLAMFGADVEVVKLALTMEQVKTYGPPPNPAKTTDPRAGAYIAEHGGRSWEVDALRPDVLAGVIRRAFKSVLVKSRMDAVIRREHNDRARLWDAVKSFTRKGG